MNIGKHRVHLSPFQKQKKRSRSHTCRKTSSPAPKARQPRWQIAPSAQDALAVVVLPA
jgi:hypothetical protein